MSNKPPVYGSCLCGKVSLTVNAFDRNIVACHCKQCRKQTGHFVAAARANNTDFTVDGEEHLTWFQASADADRGFCRHCGSTLFWRRHQSDQTSIMAGCLDNPTGLTIDSHIFTDDKGDYYSIEPDIPSHGQYD